MAVTTMETATLKSAIEHFYITSEPCVTPESMGRYIREMKKRDPKWIEFIQTTAKLRETYTPAELKLLSRGTRREPKQTKRITFSGEVFRFAHITDTHMGSVFFKEHIWDAVVNEINAQQLDAVFHTGDVVDGLNTSRTDSYYELTHIGYAQQKEYAIDMLGRIEYPIYAVCGNHDRFYLKSAGAMIVQDIAHELEHMTYLGQDMADFLINGVKLRLWHGEDGSSYAVSYRLQKLIEAFTGGDKPNVLLAGHTHKFGYFFDRHIHCLSGGAVTTQSNWMKRKRYANHTGFSIVEMVVDGAGVVKFTNTWHPFYE